MTWQNNGMPFKLTEIEENPCFTEIEENTCFSVVIDDLEGKFYHIFTWVKFLMFFIEELM
jgi:hypothetical protein